MKKVKDIPQDFMFINNDIEVAELKSNLKGLRDSSFNSFFVKIDSDCEYKSVFGMNGIVPYLEKPVYKIL